MIGTLLIANRGEIAVRIARTAAEMGIATIAVFAEDDAASLHVRECDRAIALPGIGPASYLSITAIVEAAKFGGADAIHPGYGFLSETAAFAAACEAAGLVFVGPTPSSLDLFGNKGTARTHAAACGVALLEGTNGPTTLKQAHAFLKQHGVIMLKAIAGGGGRGMRQVERVEELEAAFARCAAEATAAFGSSELYVERFLPGARHVEVQVIGDGRGGVAHLGTRECSVQRQRQKLIEWAPADGLPPETRAALHASAVEIARAAALRSLCTVEFLVSQDGASFAFIETNARLQVEHTVTEQVTGIDFVRAQLLLASGATLTELGIDPEHEPRLRGTALQARVNLETMAADGTARPSAGTITSYAPPSGRGIRVDGAGFVGFEASLRYDSLLAKVIVDVPDGGVSAAAVKASRALADFAIVGPETNILFLRALLGDADISAGKAWVTMVEERISPLIKAASALTTIADGAAATPTPTGNRIPPAADIPAGMAPVEAPTPGLLIQILAAVGEVVVAGQEIAIIEAMKMHQGISAPVGGTVTKLIAKVNDTLAAGDIIAVLSPSVGENLPIAARNQKIDLDAPRADLIEVEDRKRATLDEARPAAVARRRKTGQRTARENIQDLCDPGSFVEYGGLVIAGRSRRASTEELIKDSPADGLVMGLGTVNAALFEDRRARVAAMSYDYTVFAGTQGARNHSKTDRLLELADRWRLPLILFAEGGGGRPGDTDGGGFVRAFELFGKLSGRVPIIGIVSGRCFAGNAALLGCCDVVIGTENTSLGMGGPAMIEGGGLGVYAPEEVGPALVHVTNGVFDVLVSDEAAGVAVAKNYLSYFQGSTDNWECAEQRILRHLIPENRLRTYDVRSVIETLADSGSVLELRRGFGRAMIIALIRVEGRPMGVIANDPAHIGGAIDSDAADKAARFMQVCEAHGLPLVSLSDTPGIMVGPEVEKTGLVRHAARMFVIGANLTVPLLSIVLRKSYGLGAIAMTGGSYQASMFAISWPSGEFFGMGIEGAVKLGYRKELDAIGDPQARKAKFDELVAQFTQHAKAINTASYFGIDDVIDPAETRQWIVASLASAPPPDMSAHKRLRWIDSW